MSTSFHAPSPAATLPRSVTAGGPASSTAWVQTFPTTARAQWAANAERVCWDRSTLYATLVALLVGVLALLWSYRSNWILLYGDALQHMNIARRVLDNQAPGIAQLGTVWLPVPHILMLPFVNIDYLWHSGLAGSLVGLPCFVLAATMLFQTVRLVARYEFAAWIALLVFISNPNFLYLQTTALTEPVLYMALTASAYYLVRWSLLSSTADLVLAAGFAVLAIGSRYDGWAFALASGAIVAVTTLLRWRDADRAEGTTLAYLTLPVFAMFLWLYYNWIIFGDALAFERGRFSASFQQRQFAALGLLTAKAHLLLSVVTFSGAALLNLGSVIAGLAVVGLIVHVAANRLNPRSFPAYSYCAVYVFNVLALYLGQTIIFTPISHPQGYLNVRYGLVVLPGAAFFIGYLADFLARHTKPILAMLLLGGLLALQAALWAPGWPQRVVTVADGLDFAAQRSASLPAAIWFRHHYDGGGILYDDEQPYLIQEAGIDMHDYYLSGPLQDLALSDPARFAKWVVLTPKNAADHVNAALAGTAYLRQHYALQFKAGAVAIYRRIGPAPG